MRPLAVIALLASVLTQGCGAMGKLHSQFGMGVGTNLDDEPRDFQAAQVIAELGYVHGGLKTDTPRWSFGGTSYLMFEDPLRPGIKAIARRRIKPGVSLDLSAGPMITYDASGTFNGFTGGVALNVGVLSLRSEYVTWPFDAWDEYRYSNGILVETVHHPGGREAVWFNGLALNGTSSWWAFAVVAGVLIVAGAGGAFE